MKYFIFLLFVLLYSCRQNSNAEFESLKADLFKHVEDVSELPVYADPPTGDYEDVKEGIFSFQIDTAQQSLLTKYSKELEPHIIKYLDSGYSWVYLAAYLKYESAIPKLKQLLLDCDNFYGWEGGDYSTVDRYLDDEQYCYQLAYVAAIEYITEKPLGEAIRLTTEEKIKLSDAATNCTHPDSIDENSCPARWLLGKILGSTKSLKTMLQGLWEDKPSGAAYFLIHADSITYPHHDLSPNIYTISWDTIIEKDCITKAIYKYAVVSVTEDSLILRKMPDNDILKLGRR